MPNHIDRQKTSLVRLGEWDDRVANEAAAQGLPKAMFVRKVLREYFAGRPGQGPR
jgi:predicted DNA binding CopG/RHH family protein